MQALFETDFALPGKRRGKVRDVYELPREGQEAPRLLMVATDRLSAFDVVLPTPIPGKGRLLTSISAAWFAWIESRGITRTHVLATELPEVLPGLTREQRASVEGRAMIVRGCRVVPIECVVRGYLEGSGWREYAESGGVSGVALPTGLKRGDRLPEPIFTPATKAEQGEHDENITFDEAVERVGGGVMERLRRTTLRIYREAHAYAEERGLILADTKFEFGFELDPDGRPAHDDPVLCDEALTPDSSRYWPKDRWKPGGEQVSFDKQYVREYLQRLCDEGKWDKRAPGPELPADVVERTLEKYREAGGRLFGGATERRSDGAT